jgi:hypothetical protein
MAPSHDRAVSAGMAPSEGMAPSHGTPPSHATAEPHGTERDRASSQATAPHQSQAGPRTGSRGRRRRLRSSVERAVLERAGYACERCGRRSGLQIHHQDRVCRGGSDEPSRLSVLCRVCHAAEHHDEHQVDPTFICGRAWHTARRRVSTVMRSPPASAGVRQSGALAVAAGSPSHERHPAHGRQPRARAPTPRASANPAHERQPRARAATPTRQRQPLTRRSHPELASGNPTHQRQPRSST